MAAACMGETRAPTTWGKFAIVGFVAAIPYSEENGEG